MKKSSSLFVLAVAIVSIFFLSNYSTPKSIKTVLENGQPIVDGIETGEFLKESQPFSLSADLTARVTSATSKRGRDKTATTTSVTITPIVTPSPTPVNSFSDVFSPDYSVQENSPMSASSNINWWVNSGAWLRTISGLGQTVKGEVPTGDYWQKAYASSNPIDTDGGFHPQNIFRLVQRGSWQDFIEQAYFRIDKNNVSSSPNRNASNGLFLFNRYQNGDNLYYTGLRVDGAVVIKKKLNKLYYTMAYKPFVSSTAPYSVTTNPNLLPLNTWIGLKSEVKTNTDGTVTINFYVDINKTGNWVLALTAIDDNKTYGGGAITTPGYAGIRTDFMDVSFDDFSITSL